MAEPADQISGLGKWTMYFSAYLQGEVTSFWPGPAGRRP